MVQSLQNQEGRDPQGHPLPHPPTTTTRASMGPCAPGPCFKGRTTACALDLIPYPELGVTIEGVLILEQEGLWGPFL